MLELGVEKIYLAFDKDVAGTTAMNEFLKSDLNDYFEVKLGVELDELKDFYKSPYKDLNEYLMSL